MNYLKIIIIEDKKDQLEDIVDNMRTIARELSDSSDYPELDLKIEGINTRKVSLDKNSVEDFLKIKFEDEEPDILFLDYDLEWGESGDEFFDGDQIVKFIDEKLEMTPYLILGSNQFENKKYPSHFVNTDRLSVESKKQIHKSIFTSEWTKGGRNHKEAFLILKQAISFCFGLRVYKFVCFKMPEISNDEDGNHTKFYRAEDNDPLEIRVQSEDVVSIFFGDSRTYALLYLDNGILFFKCIHFTNKPSKNDLLRRYNLTSGKTLIYNSRYIKERNERYYFDFASNKVESNIIDSFNNYVKLADKKLADHPYLKIDKINPFYNSYIKFRGVFSERRNKGF